MDAELTAGPSWEPRAFSNDKTPRRSNRLIGEPTMRRIKPERAKARKVRKECHGPGSRLTAAAAPPKSNPKYRAHPGTVGGSE